MRPAIWLTMLVIAIDADQSCEEVPSLLEFRNTDTGPVPCYLPTSPEPIG
jgi:hypothetical protein